MKKKFDTIFEAAVTRFSRGGYLVGDYVKFAKGFKNNDAYKALGTNIKQLLDEMESSKLHLRVVGIVDNNTPRYPGNPDTMTGDVTLDIALDNGGGRYTHYTKIPACCVEGLELDGVNYPAFDDSLIRPNGTQIKPMEYSVTETDSFKTDKGGKISSTDHTLPAQNVKIPANEPATGNPYTTNYLKDF
jgi:hypothetical protein